MRMRQAVVLATAAGVAVAVMLVLRFPPARYAFYPRCPIHEYLHLECPGCGATRAVAALLHGHVAEALHANALFVAILPLLASYAAVSFYRAWTADTFRWPEVPAWITYALLAVATIFTITRDVIG